MDIRFKISEIESVSDFLSEIENRVIEKGISFIIIINDTDKRDIRSLIGDIKSHFDIFILQELYIPKSRAEVDNCFFNGFHGVYYLSKKMFSNVDIKVLAYTAELFPKGSLFLEYEGSVSGEVDQILEMNFIPVLKSCDVKLLEYTRKKIDETRKLSRYLKYVPLLEQVKCEYHIGHKLKRKLLLETDNLRQKLMIKSVEDSFNSSGL